LRIQMRLICRDIELFSAFHYISISKVYLGLNAATQTEISS
jgi:hypothetical protein